MSLIQELWAETRPTTRDIATENAIRKAMTAQSTSTLTELRRRIALQRNWAASFSALFALAGSLAFQTGADLAVGVAALAMVLYLLAVITLSQAVDGLRRDAALLGSLPTRVALEQEVTLIERALRTQDRWSYFSMPVMALCGYAYSLGYFRGYSLTDILADIELVSIVLGSVAILTPAGLYLTARLNERTYHKLLADVRGKLQALRHLDEASLREHR